MKLSAIVFFLASGIICSFASIDERILGLENIVQMQFAENEKMKGRLKELEHDVDALVSKEEKEIGRYIDDQHEIETRATSPQGLPGHLLTRAVSSSEAFHAYLSNTKCFNDYEKIIFNTEAQDDYNLYDVRDGIFEARESGVYVFTWTIATPINTRITTELIIGGTMRGKLTTDSDNGEGNDNTGSGFHPATAVVVATMSTGDHCYIQARHLLHTCINVLSSSNSVRSTFSGWKLY